MGKHGPCCHCGVTSTPLWRNGPPEKPVLCNACGSRWRTKGSLTNYTPMHARELFYSEETKSPKIKDTSFISKEQKLHRKKHADGLFEIKKEISFFDNNSGKILEEDTSNRSSSGSAISYSESCPYYGLVDASDLTGSAQSNIYDSLVPSKKRTGVAQLKPSPVEKLTKDLYSIWHEQQSYCLSGSSEDDDLLLKSNTQFGFVEMGHGGVLISNPNSRTIEEESEASSFPVDNNLDVVNEDFSGSAHFTVYNESEGTVFSNNGPGRLKKPYGRVLEDLPRRGKLSQDNLIILQDKASPLCSIDLKDFLSFDIFRTHLTQDEQKKLMEYLPPSDVVNLPDSLKSMFDCPRFAEALSFYQMLLLDGVFDLSFRELCVEDCRNLRRLVLVDLTNARWMKCYKELQVRHSTGQDMNPKMGGNVIPCNPDIVEKVCLTSHKRPHDARNPKLQEAKGMTMSPKRACNAVGFATLPPDTGSKMASEVEDDDVESDIAYFRSLFVIPSDGGSVMLAASMQCTDESSAADQDLLVVAPCNGSFPEAELLYHPCKQMAASSNGGEES